MDQNYIIKSGFKCFGEKGEHAVTLKLYQIHEINKFEPIYDNKLTKKDRK